MPARPGLTLERARQPVPTSRSKTSSTRWLRRCASTGPRSSPASPSRSTRPMPTPEPILAADGTLNGFLIDGIDQRCRGGIGTIAALGGVSPNRETIRALLWQVMLDDCWTDRWEADRTCVALFEQLTGTYDEYACKR